MGAQPICLAFQKVWTVAGADRFNGAPGGGFNGYDIHAVDLFTR